MLDRNEENQDISMPCPIEVLEPVSLSRALVSVISRLCAKK